MSSGLLRIGEVAARGGVSVDTVRHYERKGLLGKVARDDSGYRRYGLETVHRVLVIRRAISLGFSLDELADVFRERAAGKPPCSRVRDLAERKLEELDARIEALIALRSALAGTVAGWNDRLRTAKSGEFAGLLETIIP